MATELGPDSITPEDVESLVAVSRVLIGLAVLSISELDDRLSLTQFRALVLLTDAGSLKANQLASALGTSASSVTRVCDQLAVDGLIVRVPNPASRREVLIQPSAMGRRLVTRVMDRRRLDLRDILASIEAQQRPAVLAAMQLFARSATDLHGGHLLTEWPVA